MNTPEWIECPTCKTSVRITKDGLISKHKQLMTYMGRMVSCASSRTPYNLSERK